MIKTKEQYQHYLAADKAAFAKPKNFKFSLKECIAPHYTWRFQRRLRKLEYYRNCRHDFFGRLIYVFLKYRFSRVSLRFGFSIPENVFGPGLAIVHYGTIVVSHRAKVGKNCRIHVCTNIGASGGNLEAPQIGDNVYIGPGVKIFGDIVLGNNIAIGANSTVNKSFLEEGIMIAGSPARKIKDIDIKRIIPNA